MIFTRDFFPRKFSQRGQSLLEVLLASSLVSLVLVSVLSVIIASLANSRAALEQSQVNRYSQEVFEWLRHDRDDLGWTAFAESLPAIGQNKTYCLAAIPAGVEGLVDKGSTCQTGETVEEKQFTRTLKLTRVSDGEVEAEVVVIRPDRSGQVATTTELTLTEWQ